MGQREKITRNATYLFLSDVIIRFITAITTILLARYLGVADYGIISVALGVSAITGYCTNLGLNHTFIRESTKPGANIPQLIGTALRIRLILALLATIIVFFAVEFIYEQSTLRTIILFVALPTIWGRALISIGTSYFQMKQEMQFSALINLISGFVIAAVIILGIALKESIQFISIAYGASSLLSGVFSVFLVYRREPYTSEWNISILKGLCAFILSGFATVALPQLGTLILAKVGSLEQVGYFSVSYRIPMLLYGIPGILATAFYPQLFHHGARDLDQQLKLSISQLRAMLLLGVFLALPLALYPSLIIRLLFGVQWQSAGPILSLLAWVVVFRSITIPLADALTTKGMQNRRTTIEVIAVAAGVGLYWTLGTYAGVMGTAIAALIVESFILLLCIVVNPTGWKLFSISIMNSSKILIIGVVLSLSLRLLFGEQLTIALISSTTFFFIIVLMDKDYRIGSLNTLRKLRDFIDNRH